MLTGRRIVITGGAGFIACTLASKLAEHNEVVLFDNMRRRNVLLTGLLDKPNVTLSEGDVLDAQALTEVIDGASHVVHMAAVVGVRGVVASPVTTMRVNILGTFNALEAANLVGVERFVGFSTSEVFGTHAEMVGETPLSPTLDLDERRWTYAMGKLTGEFAAKSYWHEFGLPIVSIRPFNVYGPWRVGQGAVNEIMERALRGDDVVVHGDGTQIRAWCYVDDLVEGVLLAMEKKEAIGKSFNIGNPRSTSTIFNTAEQIVSLCGSPSKIVFAPLGIVDVEVRIPDITSSRTLLGYEPKVDLEEGLSRTIEWYRSFDGSSVKPLRRPAKAVAPVTTVAVPRQEVS